MALRHRKQPSPEILKYKRVGGTANEGSATVYLPSRANTKASTNVHDGSLHACNIDGGPESILQWRLLTQNFQRRNIILAHKRTPHKWTLRLLQVHVRLEHVFFLGTQHGAAKGQVAASYEWFELCHSWSAPHVESPKLSEGLLRY